jgi:acyl-CoA synthetase (AMP-forming)/AMP-acid ligase II
VGEIWVSGERRASGYWRRPEVTTEVFEARIEPNGPNDADRATPPFLRTGDLGFVDEGELFVTGRLKDLILVGGRNVYPSDVEQATEESHPAVRSGCSAAFAIENGEIEQVVVAAEVERGTAAPGETQIAQAIQRAVVDREDVRIHEVVLLAPGAIPKTSSGKVQRHACRQGYLDNTLERWRPS